jgi:hypothetical protein
MIGLIFYALLGVAGAQTQFSDLPKVEYTRNPYFESEGFRLGFLLEFAREGIAIWSYEGQFMVGYGADRVEMIDPTCFQGKTDWLNSVKDVTKKNKAMEAARKECYIFTNPWMFSTLDSRIYNRYQELANTKATPVVLYYVTPFISPENLITNTKNFVEGIYPVNESLELQPSFTATGSELPVGLNREQGYVNGRIVKASLDHVIRKSFEIVIQEGPLGNNFRRMSVSSQEMFDYIIKVMLTGREVRVGFLRLLGAENTLYRIGKDYDTAYRVTSVQLRHLTEGSPPITVPKK